MLKKRKQRIITLIGAAILCTLLPALLLSGQKIFNIGSSINSPGDDFCPSITADGSMMVFNAREPEARDHDIYFSTFKDGRWLDPVPFRVLNSPDNDETPYISPDGKTILFASDREGSMRPSVTADGTVRITYDIYISEKINGSWVKPERIRGDVNTNRNERSPSLSSDKRTVYFTRWPYMRFEKAKIYSAVLKNGEYRNSTPLPAPFNNGNYDIALTPSKSRKGFYFASRRAGGFGGWDLYFVPCKDGKYGRVKNLGKPFNSEDNEMFMSEIGEDLYFCSNRAGGLGRYDIYTTYKPGSLTRINITVTDKDSGKPVSMKIDAYLKNNPDPAARELRKITVQTDKHGFISISPRRDITWIVLKGSEKHYTPFRKVIKIEKGIARNVSLEVIPGEKKKEKKPDKKPVIKTAEKTPAVKKPGKKPAPAKTVKPAPVKKKTVLKKPFVRKPGKDKKKVRKTAGSRVPGHIFFNYNSSSIKLEYYPRIHSLIDYMRKNRNVKLLIIGRADLRPSDGSPVELSLERARTVRDYMVKMGVPDSRIRIKGLGSKGDPAVSGKPGSCCMNQSVEFRIKRLKSR